MAALHSASSTEELAGVEDSVGPVLGSLQHALAELEQLRRHKHGQGQHYDGEATYYRAEGGLEGRFSIPAAKEEWQQGREVPARRMEGEHSGYGRERDVSMASIMSSGGARAFPRATLLFFSGYGSIQFLMLQIPRATALC